MTDKSIQAFLAARGKIGEPLVDYIAAGDDSDGSVPTFPTWNVAKLGPAPTPADITTMQEHAAQLYIDNMPLPLKAIFLTILDQVNFIRNLLPVPLGPLTPAQFVAASRAKAGTL